MGMVVFIPRIYPAIIKFSFDRRLGNASAIEPRFSFFGFRRQRSLPETLIAVWNDYGSIRRRAVQNFANEISPRAVDDRHYFPTLSERLILVSL